MRTLSRSLGTLLLLAAPVAAQDVTVHSTSDVKFYGGLGKLISFASRFGGGNKNDDKTSTMYLSGHKLRTDASRSSSIIDLDAERMTMIDHDQKSYFSMTFAEFGQMAKAMQDSMRAGMQRSKARKDDEAKGDVKVDYQVSVDRPGDKQKISGYDTERMFMTVTMRADVTPEGEKTEEAGKMIFLVDEWIARDAPQSAAMKEFGRAYAQKVGRAMGGETRGMEAAFGANPQLRQGFEAVAKEREKLGGAGLRSTTYVVFVPAGMEFDRQLALNDAASAPKAEEGEKKGGGGLRGLAGALRKAAESGNQKEKSSEPPKQSTMMSILTEVQSVERGRVDPATFLPPSGYKEQKPQMRQ